MFDSNMYKSLNEPVNTNQLYYSTQMPSDKQFEDHLSLNTMANPYALYMQKKQHMIQNYANLRAMKMPQANVMKQSGQNPSQEQRLQDKFGFDGTMYTNEDFRSVGDMLWKGLKGFSRFYAQERLPADALRPDNFSRFSNVGVDNYGGIDGISFTNNQVNNSFGIAANDAGLYNVSQFAGLNV